MRRPCRVMSLMLLLVMIASLASPIQGQAQPAKPGRVVVDVHLFVYGDFMRVGGAVCGVDLRRPDAMFRAKAVGMSYSSVQRVYESGTVVAVKDSPIAGEAGCLIPISLELEKATAYEFYVGKRLLVTLPWALLTEQTQPILLAVDRNGNRTPRETAARIPTPAPTPTPRPTRTQAPTPTPAPRAGKISRNTYRIVGTFVLRSENVTSTRRSCFGNGGYDDVYPGAQVIVRDGNNNILGVGELVWIEEYSSRYSCSYEFYIEVPESTFYVITFSHRGELVYTFGDMVESDWEVFLVLGD